MAVEAYFHELLKFDPAAPITAPSLGDDIASIDTDADEAAYDLLSPLGDDGGSVLPPPCD